MTGVPIRRRHVETATNTREPSSDEGGDGSCAGGQEMLQMAGLRFHFTLVLVFMKSEHVIILKLEKSFCSVLSLSILIFRYSILLLFKKILLLEELNLNKANPNLSIETLIF